MEKLILIALVAMLAAGCLAQPPVEQPTKEELANELAGNVIAPPLISVSGDENLSVVTMRAVETGSGWQFPLSDYNDEFVNIGLYSDSFIKLNKSQIPWLGDGEAIWLTPMLRNGNGTLFNAIYSKEIDDCNATVVTVLGKEYRMSELEYGGRFENDDKWQVAVEEEIVEPQNLTEEQQIQYDLSSYREFCPKRVVIYLDGYFYDIKEDDQINLFRNDNTILFQFKDLAAPKAEVVATRPISARVLPTIAGTSIVTDSSNGKNYTMKETLNQSGLYLEFEPGILVCPSCVGFTRQAYDYPDYNDWFYASPWDLSENHRIDLDVSGRQWMLSSLEKYDTSDFVVLGEEESHALLNPGGRFPVADEEVEFSDYNNDGNTTRIILIQKENQTRIEVSAPGIVRYKDRYIRVWQFAPGYSFGDSWIEVSSFFDITGLSDPSNNVTLRWDEGYYGTYGAWMNNPALKSIFVPSTSPIFEKLTGQSNN